MKRNNNISPDILKTKDGSYTLYLDYMNETYHSRHGAIQESLHVFIQSGLKWMKKDEINILEIGFGTGLNVLLTLLHQKQNNFPRRIFFESIEKYPLSWDLVKQLNYVRTPLEKNLFHRIHLCKWNEVCMINNDQFYLMKNKTDLIDFQPNKLFDLIYFDAFAPDKQPEMWTKGVFTKLYENMNKNGVLVTYSAKGSVRRTMQSVGFEVEKIPGPPGKREMLRAKKSVG